ncbi:hypothetical protein BJ912DRAFT_1078152 [Pholiota molesta]|nr:hypothetical protein BJ912DRAFT_1078152 [Pholiota molesta]
MMINESNPPRIPMYELPYEILWEIFSRFVDQSSARVVMQPNTKIAPILLCQVCAPWRAVVLSTPALWAHLRFDLPVWQCQLVLEQTSVCLGSERAHASPGMAITKLALGSLFLRGQTLPPNLDFLNPR